MDLSALLESGSPSGAAQTLLHGISQGMLLPTMIILVLLVGYSVWCVGSVAAEALTERRRYRADADGALAAIEEARWEGVAQAVRECGMLREHKALVLQLVERADLTEDGRIALARRLLSQAEERYARIVTRMDLVAKAAPMLGLMGTLIPLGPGITAMNEGDIATLAASLNIAFDTTVVGLIASIVVMAMVRLRRHWYEDYLSNLDAVMATVLAKAKEGGLQQSWRTPAPSPSLLAPLDPATQQGAPMVSPSAFAQNQIQPMAQGGA